MSIPHLRLMPPYMDSHGNYQFACKNDLTNTTKQLTLTQYNELGAKLNMMWCDFGRVGQELYKLIEVNVGCMVAKKEGYPCCIIVIYPPFHFGRWREGSECDGRDAATVCHAAIDEWQTLAKVSRDVKIVTEGWGLTDEEAANFKTAIRRKFELD